MSMAKRGGKILAALLGLACASGALAQAYPSRAITFIYPYPPGSASDTAWRTITTEFGRKVGQTVVYENRAGAGGRVGFDGVLRGAPDGYTIGFINNVLTVWQPIMEPKLTVDPGKDYTPIILAIETPLVLASRVNAPFRDLKGLIAYAKANPGKLNASSSGPGSGAHLGIAMLNYMAGIDITHVPYKGAAPAMAALVAGEADLFFADSAAKPQVEAGKLAGIAVGSAQRWGFMANLPTMDEAGLKGFRNTSWTAVGGPPGLTNDVATRLNRGFNDVLATPDVKTKLEAAGWAIKGGTSAEFAALIRSDIELYRPVIKAANIKLDQ